MNDYEVWEIAGHSLEYFDDTHQYLVDGIIVPSITQMLKFRFKNKYSSVAPSTLKRASEKGTEVHRAIEEYCKSGKESDIKELRNFKFLQKKYSFEVLENEVPVILFDSETGHPISAGRLDMVVELPSANGMNRNIGLADIKRTSVLDKDYLAYQLNLYRIAYRQSYGQETDFLRGIHLREDTRKFVTIPINEEMTWEFIKEYKETCNE